LVPDGDGYIEIDSGGYPLGKWDLNPDTGVWEYFVFDEPPKGQWVLLGDDWVFMSEEPLPQTGVAQWPIPLLSASGILFTLFGWMLIGRKKKVRKSIINF